MSKGKYAAFKFEDPGAREHYEDRSGFTVVETAGGLTLFVAILCDGVGGIGRGEVAAEFAIRSAINFIQSSPITDVPTLLSQGIKEANEVVFNHFASQGYKSKDSGKTTLTMAAILDDESPYGRLFIANVGDSRIALVRNKELMWLTRDHNVATDYYYDHEFVDIREAQQQHHAYHLTRVIGKGSDVDPDTGIYHTSRDIRTGESLGFRGIPLREADTLYLCSDGMIDPDPKRDHVPYVLNEEFERYALGDNPESITRILLTLALGREPSDNVSLISILVAPDSRKRRPVTQVSRSMIGAVVALALLTVILFAGFLIISGQLILSEEEVATINAQSTQTQQEYAAQTAVAQAWTPIPTNTLAPTSTPPPAIEPGAIGRIHLGNSGTFKVNEPVVNNEDFAIVEVGALSVPANAYFLRHTSVRFDTVDDTNGKINLFMDSGHLLMETGSYNQGITISIPSTTASFYVSGSCMAVDLSIPDKAIMTCYSGTCGYATNVGGTVVPVPVNSRVQLDLTTYDVQAFQSIRSTEGTTFYNYMSRNPGYGERGVQMCYLDQFKPRPITPTDTDTPTVSPAAPKFVQHDPPQEGDTGGAQTAQNGDTGQTSNSDNSDNNHRDDDDDDGGNNNSSGRGNRGGDSGGGDSGGGDPGGGDTGGGDPGGGDPGGGDPGGGDTGGGDPGGGDSGSDDSGGGDSGSGDSGGGDSGGGDSGGGDSGSDDSGGGDSGGGDSGGGDSGGGDSGSDDSGRSDSGGGDSGGGDSGGGDSGSDDSGGGDSGSDDSGGGDSGSGDSGGGDSGGGDSGGGDSGGGDSGSDDSGGGDSGGGDSGGGDSGGGDSGGGDSGGD